MSALAAYRTAILALLVDSTNAIFANNDVDQALRWALAEYSLRRPLVRTYDFTVDAATRVHELPADFITRQIVKVQLHDDDLDEIVDLAFQSSYTDEGWIVYTDTEISAAEVLIIHYSDPHTIDDLDSAAGTTVPDADETLLQTGAAGRCAQMHALAQVESINMNDNVVEMYRKLALDYLASFNAGIMADLGTSVAPLAFPDTSWSSRRSTFNV